MAQSDARLPADDASNESWNTAKQLAALEGPIPSPLGDALRLLWKSHKQSLESKDHQISDECIRAVRLVERTPKLRTPLYFAASSLYPDRFGGYREDDLSKALVNILSPGLFAVILGLLYFHRRLNKISTSEHWGKLSKDFLLNMELGYMVGSASPVLGPAEGTLVGAIRYLAVAAFMVARPAEFDKYNRGGVSRKLDPGLESETWGCSHAQISAYLVNMLGFRKDVLEMGHVIRKIGGNKMQIPADLELWRSALFFIDHIKGGLCPPPDKTHSERLQITSSQACDSLLLRYSNLAEQGSSFNWMLKKGGAEEE